MKTENTAPKDDFASLGKIEAIRRLYSRSQYSYCGLITAPSGGRCSVTASVMYLEGMDFDLVYTPLKHLGHKVVTNATGELYVKMARPFGLAVRLGVSAKLDYASICELWDGMAAAAKEFGIKAVSLDLAPSANGLAISVTATGEIPKDMPQAEAPRSMDLICVSDNLGSAYMGFHVLEREKAAFNDRSSLQPDLTKYKYIVGAYLHPQINPGIVDSFKEAGFVPGAGYFVKNSLADSVRRLVSDTGLGAKIYIDKIPIADKVFDMAAEINMDPLAAAINGGDDFRYLFTIPIGRHEIFRRDFQTFDVIGHLARPEVGAVVVEPEGAELPLRAQGWQ